MTAMRINKSSPLPRVHDSSASHYEAAKFSATIKFLVYIFSRLPLSSLTVLVWQVFAKVTGIVHCYEILAVAFDPFYSMLMNVDFIFI